jgi:hypothetical protein
MIYIDSKDPHRYRLITDVHSWFEDLRAARMSGNSRTEKSGRNGAELLSGRGQREGSSCFKRRQVAGNARAKIAIQRLVIVPRESFGQCRLGLAAPNISPERRRRAGRKPFVSDRVPSQRILSEREPLAMSFVHHISAHYCAICQLFYF